MKSKCKLLFLIILISIVYIHFPVKAENLNKVTFYDNSSLTNIIDTQYVSNGGHPTRPNDLSSYINSGYCYKFKGWYWIIDENPSEFSFTSEDCEIWVGDYDIYAEYDQYLASDYYLVVVHSNGTEFIEDTETPISTLLKSYSGISSAYTISKSSFESGTSEPLQAIVNGANKTFETLDSAIQNADLNTTITLLADVNIANSTTINKAITLDLNGYRLTGSNLTIDESVIIDGTKTNSALSNSLTVNSSLSINGGDYTGMTLDINEGNVSIGEGIFSFDPAYYVDNTVYDVNEIDGSYYVSPHSHSFDYNNPSWKWIVQDNITKAVVTYTCVCGSTSEEIITPTYTDLRGVRTYEAKDLYNNKATKEETLSYTITLDGVKQNGTYHWGDICTLTNDNYRAWYMDEVSSDKKVADGTKTYTFAITEDMNVITTDTSYTEKQAVITSSITSNKETTARFNAKWSLPSNAEVISVIVYRGYTMDERNVGADTIIEYGAVHDTHFLYRNGDYTLNITDLTSGYYQHVVIVINYSINGVNQDPLISNPMYVKIK